MEDGGAKNLFTLASPTCPLRSWEISEHKDPCLLHLSDALQFNHLLEKMMGTSIHLGFHVRVGKIASLI